MCGEHLHGFEHVGWNQGSSPHVRGALPSRLCRVHSSGIIPACAGSTHASRISVPSSWDHPRMCGEHMLMDALFPQTPGSSPHVRGAQSWHTTHYAKSGIIPACAGSTYDRLTILGMNRDHPRMCGEHTLIFQALLKLRGSSPHVRGALIKQSSPHLEQGIIPACAGSTANGSTSMSTRWDHPRMCGEHAYPSASSFLHRGSSPHVRGARVGRIERHRVPGIIPACAGSTNIATVVVVLYGDHPRMCGEHMITVLK